MSKVTTIYNAYFEFNKLFKRTLNKVYSEVSSWILMIINRQRHIPSVLHFSALIRYLNVC